MLGVGAGVGGRACGGYAQSPESDVDRDDDAALAT